MAETDKTAKLDAGGPLDPLNFYATQSGITDAGEYSYLFEGLPAGIGALCEVVRGVLVHYDTLEMQGIKIAKERMCEGDSRSVALMLERILTLDKSPLSCTRPLEKRLLGCCRDFATLLAAILRSQGVAARVRFGFAHYIGGAGSGFNPDHVITEFWSAAEQRWVLVDAQQDEALVQANEITFDPCNIPREQFPVAGQAWHWVRNEQTNATCYGLGPDDLRGLPFIQHQLVQDLAAFNKREMLCWDEWGLTERGYEEDAAEYFDLLDEVAALTLAGRSKFTDMLAIYQRDALRVPDVIKCRTMASNWKEVKPMKIAT